MESWLFPTSSRSGNNFSRKNLPRAGRPIGARFVFRETESPFRSLPNPCATRAWYFRSATRTMKPSWPGEGIQRNLKFADEWV